MTVIIIGKVRSWVFAQDAIVITKMRTALGKFWGTFALDCFIRYLNLSKLTGNLTSNFTDNDGEVIKVMVNYSCGKDDVDLDDVNDKTRDLIKVLQF